MPDGREHVGERTEMPTPLRLAEARRQGQVPRSTELAAATVALAGLAALAVLGGAALGAIRRMVSVMLSQAGAGDAAWSAQAAQAVWPAVGWVGAMMLVVIVAAVAANVAQFGLLLSGEPVRVNLARLSPSAGLARMFSLRSAVRAAMSAAKIAVVAAVVWAMVRGVMAKSMFVAVASVEDLAEWVGRDVLSGGFWTAAGLAGLAIVDLIYQRWQYRQDLKMTRREFLEDLRTTEGDSRTRRHVAGTGGRARRSETAAGSGQGG